MPERHSHCSFCGQRFAPGQPWPRTCLGCGEITFVNPEPVSVVLVSVDEGLLAVRRDIEPGRGRLALPGGYINLGESWQAAGAREVLEETGVSVAPDEIAVFDVQSAQNPNGPLLIFGLARPRRALDLPPFTPNDEATERVVLAAPQTLAFQTHTLAVRKFFERNGG